MRVALNAMLLGRRFSGVEVTIRQLITALNSHTDIPLTVFTPVERSRASRRRPTAADSPDQPAPDVHRIRIPLQSRLLRILWEHVRLPRAVRKANCNLLHCPGYIAPLRSPVPVVLTVHDCIALKHPEFCTPLNRLYYRLTLPGSIRRATRIIVPTRAVATDLQTLCNADPDRVDVIPFAPADAFRPVTDPDTQTALQQRYNLPDTFVVFVGNHEPKKNLAGILRAFAIVAEQHAGRPPAHLVLAGNGTDSAPVQSLLKQLNITHQTATLGYVPFADLPALYSAAEASLFPSLAEGFGLPILEAMACATPVITSNRHACAEVAGNAAVTADPETPESIAAAMQRMLGNADVRARLAQHALDHARNFTWQKTATQTANTYRQATARPNPPR